MQVEITQEVEKMIKEALKIVEILKEKTNSKNYTELAKTLGLTSSSLSLAKSRGSIGLLLEAAYRYSLSNDINLLQYLNPCLSRGSHEKLISEGSEAERLNPLKVVKLKRTDGNAIYQKVFASLPENLQKKYYYLVLSELAELKISTEDME